ncbi:stalk domain-containing protein [Gorillibacterium sp. CAU 1737]|uniref:stalk domain-containing protein n=1 Tax=Gorillibacterium sp. CAU 1737 TaxID=3140362 RepID=UPI003260F498
MKKFWLGLLCGALLAGTSVAVVISLQARQVNVSFLVNGKEIKLEKPDKVLEVDGRLYAPVRFLAESLGGTSSFEEESRKLILQHGPLSITDPNVPSVSVGNLVLTRSGNRTEIIGQLQYSGIGNTVKSLEGSLTFYDAANQKLGSALVTGTFGVETRIFTTSAPEDLRAYDTMILNVQAEDGKSIAPAPTFLYENWENGFSLALPEFWRDKFTVIPSIDSDHQVTSLTFVDNANVETGGVLFTINLYPKKVWEESGKTLLEQVPSWQMGEAKGRVYAMAAASDVQYNLQNEALAQEYEAMRRSMERIRISFSALR